MDLKTLTTLLKEANKNYKQSSKLFDKYDNHEDMHEADHWKETVSWLQDKIDSLKVKG